MFRRRWWLTILVLLLLALLVSFLLYRFQPRNYAFFWPRILAHVHPPRPGIPNCVPNDLANFGDPDFHDAWAAPASQHRIQHIEWLGDCVSEEAAPRAADTFDDGLRRIQIPPQGAWQPGSQFQLSVLVSTAFSNHGIYFQRGNVSLAIFADWNNNNTFENAELIFSWVGNPPFNQFPNDPDSTLVDTPPINVPAGYATPGSQPKLRLRLVYVEGQNPDTAPGGNNVWGEVEDYGDEELPVGRNRRGTNVARRQPG